jgi:all-trans-retinol 13,14-reductase
MVQSYKKSFSLNEPYDAILIGSGLGSLSAGAMLAKEGYKVLILERHYTAGGFTHVFKRPGYEWDVGIHYIGEMQRPNSAMRKLFDYVTDGELKWADMGEVYDRIVLGEEVYDFVKGVDNWRNRMVGYFPEEATVIDAYISLVMRANKTSSNFYLEKAFPPILSKLFGARMRKPFLKFASRTTREVLEELTQNERLIKVLTGQYGDYGLPPAESSFSMHAAVVRHYFAGGSFPVGGSARIVETILPLIEAAGGSLLINAEVTEILVENKKAVGVQMADGRTFRAPLIISGTGILNTYQRLLPTSWQEKPSFAKPVLQVKPSVAHACLYVGLKHSPEELQLPKANYWLYPAEGTHEENVAEYLADIEAPFPVVYISFPAAKDPSWQERYPGRSTIDLITLMPYEIFAEWEEARWKKRGDEYEALKERISQRLLAELYRMEPHLKGKVDCYELSTPLTTKHFVNYERGEIYGLDHTPERFQQDFLRPKTPLKNLYLTGQDLITAGIGGALFSGLLTAAAITRKNLMSKVMKPSTRS